MEGIVLDLTLFALFVSALIVMNQLRKIRAELDRDAFERELLLHKTESLLIWAKMNRSEQLSYEQQWKNLLTKI